MWLLAKVGGKIHSWGGQYGRIYSNIKSTYLNIHKISFFSLSLRKQLHMCPESCTRWFTVALFTKEHWELPKCLGTEEWLNKPNIVRQSMLYSSSKEQTRDIYQHREISTIFLGQKCILHHDTNITTFWQNPYTNNTMYMLWVYLEKDIFNLDGYTWNT